MTEQPERKTAKQLKIEVTDVTMLTGLILLFLGLGFAISFPVSLAITGAVLILLTVWLLTPRPAKGK